MHDMPFVMVSLTLSGLFPLRGVADSVGVGVVVVVVVAVGVVVVVGVVTFTVTEQVALEPVPMKLPVYVVV